MIAQTDVQTDGPGVFDNDVLDQFEIPFGNWMDQAVDWIDVNLDWLLSAIEWPFSTLLGFVVDDVLLRGENGLSWVWVCLAFFVIGSLMRNVKVGAFSFFALATCGILGNAYWQETARTIGFIFVAVLLCVIIGIPIGVACGRIDPIWKVVRPALDAMQVVHSFVYMLPFIFFFGIGSVSATMVTMVFALPPLIRLTNLGIRQVPEDVVEASRAYGAPEWRVLADVQLPLARPAIMTGLNQTLLLAISMLGIAAIMGAGGLGQLLFRALSNQDVAFATSGGLAFFLVAVVLDRISQREDTDSGNMWSRIRLAWTHRRDPETLIMLDDDDRPPARPEPTSRFADVTSVERNWMGLTAVGGLLAIVSVFLTWTNDGGKISAFGRRTDEVYTGESFSGLAASGGSWFGFINLGLGLFIVAAVIVALRYPGEGPRWMTSDGAVIATLALVLTNVSYLLAKAPAMGEHSTGMGVWLAIIGSALAAVGAILWIREADHSPLHPLSADITWGRLVGVSLAVILLFIGSISGWSFDGRQDVIVNEEIQAEIERLTQKAEDEPENAGSIAAELSGLMASAQQEGVIVTSGVSDSGSQLGIWTLILGVAGLAATVPAAGALGRGERRQWIWSTITAGIGASIICVSGGWIATHVRSADPNYVSGVGSFVTMVGGFLVLASSGAVLKEFRRTKKYDDDPTAEVVQQLDLSEQLDVVADELV